MDTTINFAKALNPNPKQKQVLKYYSYISWLIPVIKIIFPSIVTTMKQVAEAMIFVSQNGYRNNVIYVKDIKAMSK